MHNDFAIAQDKPVQSDSIYLYKNIESYSRRSKVTKLIYRFIFKPVATSSPPKKIKKKKKLIQKPYSAFEGKTIRYIHIETLDPFGYSIADTIVTSQNFISKAGNTLHMKSQQIAIRNLLLIRQNQKFDSLLVKESERLVRNSAYITDVSFFALKPSKKSDSVDIFIRVLDNWSITAKVAASNTRMVFNLNDKNFLGLGHQFQNGFIWYHTNGDYAYNTNYFIPNIRNTYINTTLHYGTDEFRNFTKSFAMDRPFFSPFAKWAAGVNFSQQLQKDSLYSIDSVLALQRIRLNTQDYWAGNAMQIFKGNSENNRTTNFITAVRFLRIRYLEKPVETFDPLHQFSDEDFYMASVGITTRKYVQDKYIFKYGLTEDVPIGKVYSLTGGYQIKNNIGRLYLGARFSFGNYYPWGYLSTDIEYGTFFRASHAGQGVLIAGLNYFTGLFEIGKWKFRQFVKPQLTVGINRLSGESLSFNGSYGIDGFNSTVLKGTSRLLFTFQTQSYAPWNLIGFRFGPYLICSLGMLGNATSGFQHSEVYSQIGVGILIKNEYLIINTFQFSFSFYPIIPGNGQNIIKMNSFKTNNFGFRDFETGKPAVVGFQ